MPRVLIPSDNRDFVAQLAAAYVRRGWEVVVGVANLDLHGARFDAVHLQWPEELAGWAPPSPERIAAIAQSLDRWRADGARLMLTVHNLLPHRQGHDPGHRALVEVCHQRVAALLHFTEASRRLVAAEFPGSAKARNVVTGFFNFDALLPAQRDPAAARRRLGIAPEEFVVLSFGMLREWAEVVLIRDAFDAVRTPRKRLLMAGRYEEYGPVWRQRWRRWSWARWLAQRRAAVAGGFVPDDQVHEIVDAADALIVPRLDALNSGLIALAATFGKAFIAPDGGSFPDLAAGTTNPLYRPGDSRSLGAAIDTAAKLDRDATAKQNRALAEAWSWDKLVAAGLEACDLGAGDHR